MVWFSEDVLTLDMIFEHFLTRMRNIPIDEGEELSARVKGSGKSDVVSPTLQVMVPLSSYYRSAINLCEYKIMRIGQFWRF